MLVKGDHVSITYRNGKEDRGSYILETLGDCEVEAFNGSILKVKAMEHLKGPRGGEVEILHFTFDINSPEFVGATPG